MKTTVEAKGKGHFEVAFMDGGNDIAFYATSLAMVIHLLDIQCPKREPKSISWVSDEEEKA